MTHEVPPAPETSGTALRARRDEAQAQRPAPRAPDRQDEAVEAEAHRPDPREATSERLAAGLRTPPRLESDAGPAWLARVYEARYQQGWALPRPSAADDS